MNIAGLVRQLLKGEDTPPPKLFFEFGGVPLEMASDQLQRIFGTVGWRRGSFAASCKMGDGHRWPILIQGCRTES